MICLHPNPSFAEDNLEDAIRKCEEIAGSTPEIQQTWEMRTAALNENWEGSRRELFEAMIKAEAFHSFNLCSICQNDQAIVRCSECGGNRLCLSCDGTLHNTHLFHDRDIFQNGCFQPVSPSDITADEQGTLLFISEF